MALKNNRAPLLCFFKLCAAFCTHWWIQTSITVRKRPIWVKFDDFKRRGTLKFDGWPCKTIGHLFYATSSFLHHFVAIGEFKLELQSGNAQFGSNSTIFRGGDLEIWRMALKNNRAPLLCFFKLCAAFCTHWWIQTAHLFYASSNLRDLIAATGLVISNSIQIVNFSARDREIWRMTLQYNRAPLLCYFKLCASFCSHWWIQTSITVRKRPIWVKFDDF